MVEITKCVGPMTALAVVREASVLAMYLNAWENGGDGANG